MAYKNILVGIDGSKRAERAFETAVDLAKVFRPSCTWSG